MINYDQYNERFSSIPDRELLCEYHNLIMEQDAKIKDLYKQIEIIGAIVGAAFCAVGFLLAKLYH